jgi:hypothetical protein
MKITVNSGLTIEFGNGEIKSLMAIMGILKAIGRIVT